MNSITLQQERLQIIHPYTTKGKELWSTWVLANHSWKLQPKISSLSCYGVHLQIQKFYVHVGKIQASGSKSETYLPHWEHRRCTGRLQMRHWFRCIICISAPGTILNTILLLANLWMPIHSTPRRNCKLSPVPYVKNIPEHRTLSLKRKLSNPFDLGNSADLTASLLPEIVLNRVEVCLMESFCH